MAPPAFHAPSAAVHLDRSWPLRTWPLLWARWAQTLSWALQPHTWLLSRTVWRLQTQLHPDGGTVRGAHLCWVRGLGPAGQLSTPLLWTPGALGRREHRRGLVLGRSLRPSTISGRSHGLWSPMAQACVPRVPAVADPSCVLESRSLPEHWLSLGGSDGSQALGSVSQMSP